MRIAKRKMTVKQFQRHYNEFIENYSYYKSLDLNFDTVMYMRGLSKETFNILIKQI